MKKWAKISRLSYKIYSNGKYAFILSGGENGRNSAIYDAETGKRMIRLSMYNQIRHVEFISEDELLLRTMGMLYAIWNIKDSAETWRWQYPNLTREHHNERPFVWLGNGRILDITPIYYKSDFKDVYVFCLDCRTNSVTPIRKGNGEILYCESKEEAVYGGVYASPALHAYWYSTSHTPWRIYRIDPESLMASAEPWAPSAAQQFPLLPCQHVFIDSHGYVWYEVVEEIENKGFPHWPIWPICEKLLHSSDEGQLLRIPSVELGYREILHSANGRWLALWYDQPKNGQQGHAVQIFDTERRELIGPEEAQVDKHVLGWIGDTLYLMDKDGNAYMLDLSKKYT